MAARGVNECSVYGM